MSACTRCGYCGTFSGVLDARGFCADCVAAHAGRACESRPGSCAVCDGDCAACAVMSADDRESAGYSCGVCGVDCEHDEGVHTVQYGVYHEFTCHGCAGGAA